jgi:hypothetical protein
MSLKCKSVFDIEKKTTYNRTPASLYFCRDSPLKEAIYLNYGTFQQSVLMLLVKSTTIITHRLTELGCQAVPSRQNGGHKRMAILTRNGNTEQRESWLRNSESLTRTLSLTYSNTKLLTIFHLHHQRQHILQLQTWRGKKQSRIPL